MIHVGLDILDACVNVESVLSFGLKINEMRNERSLARNRLSDTTMEAPKA